MTIVTTQRAPSHSSALAAFAPDVSPQNDSLILFRRLQRFYLFASLGGLVVFSPVVKESFDLSKRDAFLVHLDNLHQVLLSVRKHNLGAI